MTTWQKARIKNEIYKQCTVPVKNNLVRHHWSYNDKHASDIIYLKNSKHIKLHSLLKYDISSKMFMSLSGLLLDTKEKHFKYLLNRWRCMKEFRKTHDEIMIRLYGKII